MKTTTTLSQTKTGRYQIVRIDENGKETTYCFGTCEQWADRFYSELVNREILVKESPNAKIVYTEGWAFRVYNLNDPYKNNTEFRSIHAINIEKAEQIYNRMNEISGIIIALRSNPVDILDAMNTNSVTI